jgi:glycosyltransferase involved in cell wall biosynthesis
MKKIIFGITDLNIGGAERVLIDLVNNLKEDYKITIFTVYGNGELQSKLSKKINIINMTNKKYNQLNIIQKKFYGLIFNNKLTLKIIYNKYIKDKYDTEIAFLEGPITKLFAINKSKNKLAWVHTNLSNHIINKNKIKQYQAAYQNYNKIIFVSNDALNGFNKVFNIKVDKQVIYNYTDINNIKNQADEYEVHDVDTTIPTFLCVCRLVKAKAIDRLVLVSKKLIEKDYNHRIYIIGDGPEKNNINNLIQSLNMNNNFFLMGKHSNPLPYMKKVEHFILPSLYEGYGMVLIDAMILQKKIIITDTGAKEALEGYENKVIAENSLDGIYNAMKKIINKDYQFNNKTKSEYNPNQILEEIKQIL